MLWETHIFEPSVHEILFHTYNYETSIVAHRLLEKLVMRKCNRAKTIDYWLRLFPSTLLRIAKTEEFRWLLQAELRAIKDGLKFIDKESTGKFSKYSYRGYLNEHGRLQGVGI